MPGNAHGTLIVGIYDARGRPARSAPVISAARPGGRKAALCEWSASRGACVLRRLPAGDYVVRREGLGERQERSTTIATHATTRELFIVVPPGAPRLLRSKVVVPLARPNTVAVKLDPMDPGLVDQRLAQVAREAGLGQVGGAASGSGSLLRVFRMPPQTEERESDILIALEETGAAEVGLVVRRDRGSISFATRLCAVRFRGDATEARAQAFADRWDLTPRRRLPYAGGAYVMRSNGPAGRAWLRRLMDAAGEDDVDYAEHILAGTNVLDQPAAPPALLYGLQWHLEKIFCAGGWDRLGTAKGATHAFGDPDIVLAILDGGVDLANAAFSGTVSNGANKVLHAFDFARMVANNDVRHEAGHGTRCAGIALASGTANSGVTGAAANCRLLALRTPGVGPDPVASELDFAEAYLWAAGLDPQNCTANFPAPLPRGADIISSSFAGPTKDLPISSLMKGVFDDLTDKARNGLGTLLFFSSGTFFGPGESKDLTLRRPWAAYERTFAIGASTLADDGATEIHPDYSGHGGLALLDLCAPSHDEGIPPALAAPDHIATVTSDEVGGGNVPRVAFARTTLTADAAPALHATELEVADNAGFQLYGCALIEVENLSRAETVQILGMPGGQTKLLVKSMREAHPAGATIIHGPKDCTLTFGGTSSATPLCAGVAALVLSANPGLTWREVRDLLRQTADRIDCGNVDPVGAWCDPNGKKKADPGYAGADYSRWYGFGRINAEKAVSQALAASAVPTPAPAPVGGTSGPGP